MPDRPSESCPPHSRPATDKRPFGSHRFDVVSIKAGRRLTLFGIPTLRYWLRLETDPVILQLCERPIVSKSTSPALVVDFWASGATGSFYVILVSGGRAARVDSGEKLYPSFQTWAASHGCGVQFVQMAEPTPHDKLAMRNWFQMLQHIARYQHALSPESRARFIGRLSRKQHISELLARSNNDDPEVIRALAFDLLRLGKLQASDLGTTVLSDGLLLETV